MSFIGRARDFLLTASMALIVSVPTLAQAQGDRRAPPPPVDQGQLTAYAKAFVAIAQARAESQAELAKPANKTSEAQQELRENLRSAVTRIIRAHGLSEARYSQITFAVSSDTALRGNFEGELARLAAAKPPPEPGNGPPQ